MVKVTAGLPHPRTVHSLSRNSAVTRPHLLTVTVQSLVNNKFVVNGRHHPLIVIVTVQSSSVQNLNSQYHDKVMTIAVSFRISVVKTMNYIAVCLPFRISIIKTMIRS